MLTWNWNNVGAKVYTGMMYFMAASENDAKGICERHNEQAKDLRQKINDLIDKDSE